MDITIYIKQVEDGFELRLGSALIATYSTKGPLQREMFLDAAIELDKRTLANEVRLEGFDITGLQVLEEVIRHREAMRIGWGFFMQDILDQIHDYPVSNPDYDSDGRFVGTPAHENGWTA